MDRVLSILICAMCCVVLRIDAFQTFNTCVKNDDFCDCGDDEPATGACSYYSKSTFECKDNRYFSQSVPTSRLRDGICDCCDGSDEKGSSVVCDNVCDEVGQEYKAQFDAKEKMRQAGLQEKEKIIRRSMGYLDLLQNQQAKSGTTIPEIEKEIAILTSELAKEETLEKLDIENLIQNAHKDFVARFYSQNPNVNQLSRNELTRLIGSLTLNSGENGVELVLKEIKGKLEGLGDEPDETEALYLSMQNMITVKSSKYKQISIQEDGSSSLEINPQIESMVKALALERLSDSSLRFVLPLIIIKAMTKGVLGKSIEGAGIDDNLIIEDVPEPPRPEDFKSYSRPSKTKLLENIKDLEEKLKKVNQSVIDSKRILQFDFGPNNFLFPLWNTCYETRDKTYKYRVCPFQQAKQENTLLGIYSGYSKNKQGQIVLTFTRGDRCVAIAGQPQRKLTVILGCSVVQELGIITEPSVCEYETTFMTPLGCF